MRAKVAPLGTELVCVVSATGAGGRIPDGALIEVDADLGTVTVLEVPVP